LYSIFLLAFSRRSSFSRAARFKSAEQPVLGTEHPLELPLLVEVAHEARKITIAGDDDRPVIARKLDHCLEDQLGVNVSLGLSVASICDGLEDQGIAHVVKPGV
jgi:hypothetical protein